MPPDALLGRSASIASKPCTSLRKLESPSWSFVSDRNRTSMLFFLANRADSCRFRLFSPRFPMLVYDIDRVELCVGRLAVFAFFLLDLNRVRPVSYTHLTLPTKA